MKKILVAQRVKEYRLLNRLTQEEFGKLLGVSPQAVSKWEREEGYPDITLLPDLASLLSCDVGDFFKKD